MTEQIQSKAVISKNYISNIESKLESLHEENETYCNAFELFEMKIKRGVKNNILRAHRLQGHLFFITNYNV